MITISKLNNAEQVYSNIDKIMRRMAVTVEEVTLARSVPADDYIVPLVERFNDDQLAVAFEALDDHLWTIMKR